MVEKRHKRPRACKQQREYRSNAQFNPKEIAGKRISESLTLNNQFRKPRKAKAAKEKPKSGHHGHDAEIRRRKQPRQDTYRSHRHNKVRRLTGNGRPSTTNCSSTKPFICGDSTKSAVRLKRFQLSFIHFATSENRRLKGCPRRCFKVSLMF